MPLGTSGGRRSPALEPRASGEPESGEPQGPERYGEILRWRRRLNSWALDAMLGSMARLGRMHPAADPKRHGVELLRDVPYRTTGIPEHRLDVYRPRRGNGPWPIVVYFHGGGFRVLSKDTHWVMGLAFARAGMTVFNVSYRLAPRHPFPAAVQDALAAYHWVLHHAARFGGDLGRIVLAGESAGANLALTVSLCAAMRRPEPWARPAFEEGRVPDACIPTCGILQVSETDRFGGVARPPSPFARDRMMEITEAYLGGPLAKRSPATALADPLLILESDVPFERPFAPLFVGCGTADPVFDDSLRLEAAARRRGIEVTARWYEEEPHAFQALVWREAAGAYWRDVHEFLRGAPSR